MGGCGTWQVFKEFVMFFHAFLFYDPFLQKVKNLACMFTSRDLATIQILEGKHV